MSTTMIFGYLKHERYEEALNIEQGLLSAYTFLREQNHTVPGKTGIEQRL